MEILGLPCSISWLIFLSWELSHQASCVCLCVCVYFQCLRVNVWPSLTAAAAKSLQLCPTLCNPIDGSPPGSPVPGILPARTLEWVAISFQCMKVKSESEVAQLCLTLSDVMDCSLPGSSIHGIFQARVLEWGAITFSDCSWPNYSCCTVVHFFLPKYWILHQTNLQKTSHVPKQLCLAWLTAGISTWTEPEQTDPYEPSISGLICLLSYLIGDWVLLFVVFLNTNIYSLDLFFTWSIVAIKV